MSDIVQPDVPSPSLRESLPIHLPQMIDVWRVDLNYRQTHRPNFVGRIDNFPSCRLLLPIDSSNDTMKVRFPLRGESFKLTKLSDSRPTSCSAHQYRGAGLSLSQSTPPSSQRPAKFKELGPKPRPQRPQHSHQRGKISIAYSVNLRALCRQQEAPFPWQRQDKKHRSHSHQDGNLKTTSLTPPLDP